MPEQKKSQFMVSNMTPKFRSQPIQELGLRDIAKPYVAAGRAVGRAAKDFAGGMRGRSQQISQMNQPVGPGGDPYAQQAKADVTAAAIPQSKAAQRGQQVAQAWKGQQQAGGGLRSRLRGAIAGARAPVAQPPAAPPAAPPMAQL